MAVKKQPAEKQPATAERGPAGRAAAGRRPLLRVAAVCLAVALLLVLLGTVGVAPWAGFGSQYGGVSTIALLGVASAAAVVLATLLRLQWRPLTVLQALVVAFACLVIVAIFPPRWLLDCFHNPAGPIFYFETHEPLVALTIDDGVHPDTTPLVLDALAERGAKATFFVLSDTLNANRELVERILQAGHELANHQTVDLPLITLPPDEAEREIVQADAALREFVEPKWFRPGGGMATEEAIAVARRLGCPCVLGSVFPFDSHISWTAFLAAYAGERPTPGDIIVLHDGPGRGVRTADALRRALPRLSERGLRCVTLSELADASP